MVLCINFFLLFALIQAVISLKFEGNGDLLSNIRGKRQTESGIEGKWHTGPWQDCSKEGYQVRSVYCADNTGNPVNDQQLAEEMCPPQEAPQSYQECKVEKLESANTEQHQHFSQGRWIVGDWSQCDPTIRGSFQHRQVACYNWKNCPVSDHLCSHSPKPETRAACPKQEDNRRQ